MQILKVTRERLKIVHNDISDGSEPAMRFYIMVTVSTLIACFGLISNSTAVVIGAMLVAPLMTPIFGMSLALVRGETSLLGHAVQAEIVGVASAVTMSFILGSLLGDFEPTAEMLSRTRPNLFDLIIAVLAGFAGAYALIDEKISPALPGVAIATAIVPPLANTGLCLSLGEVGGAIGSFLLFFANFLSILLVASATFVLSNMAKTYNSQAKKVNFIRRFGLPLIAFVFIAVFLGNSLLKIYEERRIIKTIRSTLIDELSKLPSTKMGKMNHYQEGDKVHVLANVYTPNFLTTTQVTRMQEKLTEMTDKPTELILHCIIGNNVSALDSVNNVITPRLDGTFIKISENRILNDIATSEQIIRRYFAIDKALDLIRVEFLNFANFKVVLAHIFGVRQLEPREIGLLENRIREAIGDDTIKLVISSFQKNLIDSDGPIRYGWALGDQATPEIREQVHRIRVALSAAFEHDDAYELVNINTTRLDGKLHFLLEIVGSQVISSNTIEALEARLNQDYSEPILLYAWSRIEVVHGPEGALSMVELQRQFSNRQKENYPKEIPLILEASSQ